MKSKNTVIAAHGIAPNGLVRTGLVRISLAAAVAATLVACAVKREPEVASTQPSEELPKIVNAETKTAADAPAVLKSKRQVREQDKLNQVVDLNEVIVTGSSIGRGRTMTPTFPRKAQASQGAPIYAQAIPHLDYAPPTYQQPTNTEKYDHQDDNPVHLAAEQPVSTFSIDVDTGAYANVRRFLNAGQLPPQDAVRVEELINYFDYSYAPPANRSTPFRVATEVAATPWNPSSVLLKIGIKGYEIPANERPPANLVFLIDVSGSMNSPDKLPLLKNAFHMLTDQLKAKDSVSMVVYAGNSGVVLEPTPGDQKHKIHDAINRLEAGGSTNGGQGIKLAYQLAHDAHIDKGINRVVLATDGDFNVGVVNFESLIDIAEHERASGTALTTLGFGTGNYNDKLLERLADAGNGNYAYVDTLNEARKVFVSELSSTLFTIAKDVKIQVEFNPSEVLEYRLIGYENRKLAREDFNNDKVDAGEIGAGHRVTALYEVVLAGGKGHVDPLRYGVLNKAIDLASGKGGEIANVRVRYKQPDSEQSSLLEYPIQKSSMVTLDKATTDLRFAASVAAFGQLLKGGKYVNKYDFDAIAKLAKSALGEDSEGYRREFVSLVKLADALVIKTPERVSNIGK